MTALFCRKVDDFAPIRSGGEWAPAERRPAMKKVSAHTGAEAGAVSPVGLEPTTFGVAEGGAGHRHIVAANRSTFIPETARRAEGPSSQHHHGSRAGARQ